jgi:hypothetical protein
MLLRPDWRQSNRLPSGGVFPFSITCNLFLVLDFLLQQFCMEAFQQTYGGHGTNLQGLAPRGWHVDCSGCQPFHTAELS